MIPTDSYIARLIAAAESACPGFAVELIRATAPASLGTSDTDRTEDR